MRVFMLCCCICLFFVSQSAAFMGLFRSGPETVTESDGEIVLDASSLKAGSSRMYQWQDGGATIRFMLVRDYSGVLRTALDACEVCWRDNKGYRQEERAMLCVNCGQRFALNRIGLVRGGCNPHPIASRTEDNTVRIAASDLRSGRGYFPAR